MEKDLTTKSSQGMKSDIDTYTTLYPQADKFADTQLKIFWLPDEIKVEKDVQDVLVNMTDAEKHGVTTTLKLFTLYELSAGSGYWLGRFMNTFKRPELQRMASVFGMMELGVHKVFYQKINELLSLHKDSFYNQYKESKTLSARMDSLGKVISDKDELFSIAAFSFVEGAILYSSFAFLKHFQSNGSNKLLNIVRGINFSVRDENIHAEAGAWVFNQLKAEEDLSEDDANKLQERIYDYAAEVYHHEDEIIEMIFSEGEMVGITKIQLQNFVKSRVNLCLHNLGYKKNLFEVKYNPVADWFYDGINGFVFNDIFSGVGNSYNREWSETDFVYKEYDKKGLV